MSDQKCQESDVRACLSLLSARVCALEQQRHRDHLITQGLTRLWELLNIVVPTTTDTPQHRRKAKWFDQQYTEAVKLLEAGGVAVLGREMSGRKTFLRGFRTGKAILKEYNIAMPMDCRVKEKEIENGEWLVILKKVDRVGKLMERLRALEMGEDDDEQNEG